MSPHGGVGRRLRRVPVRELIDPFKSEVRGRWAAILATGPGSFGTSSPADAGDVPGDPSGDWRGPGRAGGLEAVDPEPGPDLAFEQRDRYRALVACVLGALLRHPADERTRRSLRRVWGYLRVWAAEGGRGGDRLPPDREIARRLKIPRERVPSCLATIRGLIAACQASEAGAPGVRRDSSRPETPRPGSN